MQKNTKSVAIADDHKLFRKLLINVLEKGGWTTTVEAGNGQDLLDHLPGNLPDVILLDLNMPVMNGLETIPLLRKKWKSIPILVVSMCDKAKYISKAVEYGAVGYVSKNSDPEEIITALDAIQKKGYYFNDITNKALIKKFEVDTNCMNIEENNLEKLSLEERNVLNMICEEKSYTEIASKLYISPRTVEGIRNRLVDKIGTKSTIGLVVYAIEKGLVVSERSVA